MTTQADFIAAQARAERVAQVHGTEAPPPVTGETLTQYRARLLRQFQPNSATWARVQLSSLAPDALGVAEAGIYADSISAATRNSGPLREVVETDRTGRRISRFFGDAEACWGPFKQPARLVTGWNTKP